MDLREKSAKISCDSMTYLAKKEIYHYNSRFNYITSPKICNDDELNYGYLPSITINKKSCIYKKTEYHIGNWTNQFYVDDIKIKFNEQTKNL